MDQTENKENMEAMEEEQIVVITDDEGNELYFREEMVVPVGKKNFAILAQINLEDCECEDEDCQQRKYEGSDLLIYTEFLGGCLQVQRKCSCT